MKIVIVLLGLLILSCSTESRRNSVEKNLPHEFQNVKAINEDWFTFEYDGTKFLFYQSSLTSRAAIAAYKRNGEW